MYARWFFFFNFYCYSITVVCLFSPSLCPTPAERTSLPHLQPPPWFCPCGGQGFCHCSFVPRAWHIINIPKSGWINKTNNGDDRNVHVITLQIGMLYTCHWMVWAKHYRTLQIRNWVTQLRNSGKIFKGANIEMVWDYQDFDRWWWGKEKAFFFDLFPLLFSSYLQNPDAEKAR